MNNNPMFLLMAGWICFLIGFYILLFGNIYIIFVVLFLSQPIINWSRKQQVDRKRENQRVSLKSEKDSNRNNLIMGK